MGQVTGLDGEGTRGETKRDALDRVETPGLGIHGRESDTGAGIAVHQSRYQAVAVAVPRAGRPCQLALFTFGREN